MSKDILVLHGAKSIETVGTNKIALYKCNPYEAKISAEYCKRRKAQAEVMVGLKTPFKDTTEDRLRYSLCLQCKSPIYKLEEDNDNV